MLLDGWQISGTTGVLAEEAVSEVGGRLRLIGDWHFGHLQSYRHAGEALPISQLRESASICVEPGVAAVETSA